MSDNMNAQGENGNWEPVPFRNGFLMATKKGGIPYVAIKPMSDSLGLAWGAQWNRIQRDPILSEGIFITKMPSLNGGVQDTTCLRLDLVNGWLFGIDESRVKDEVVREKVLSYKRECYGVLFAHFYGKAAEAAEAPADRKPFPDWTTDDLRTRRGIVDMYRLTFGGAAAQWIVPQLGFPVPPPNLIQADRQMDMFRTGDGTYHPPAE